LKLGIRSSGNFDKILFCLKLMTLSEPACSDRIFEKEEKRLLRRRFRPGCDVKSAPGQNLGQM
jgi:hypothetical protein